MASAGCGRIVLTSRSQPNPQAQKTIERLRSNGADIVVECGNIADARTAGRLVSAATATGLPLRGVLHAAAVVDDATIGNITDELIDRDWSPKVFGAWYLHQATAGQPLDWFCSFSSAAALLGSPGQGAYAAANSWLDAFTAWRRSHGLPGTAIAWGAWDQIGRGAGLAQRGDTTMISPTDGAHAFRALLRYDRGYTGYLPLTGAPWLTSLAARSPFAEKFRCGRVRRGRQCRRRPRRASHAVAGGMAQPLAPTRQRSGEPDPAPPDRPRSSVRRAWAGLAGQPGIAYPHRNSDRCPGHAQDRSSRTTRCVRWRGIWPRHCRRNWCRSRLTSQPATIPSRQRDQQPPGQHPVESCARRARWQHRRPDWVCGRAVHAAWRRRPVSEYG